MWASEEYLRAEDEFHQFISIITKETFRKEGSRENRLSFVIYEDKNILNVHKHVETLWPIPLKLLYV